jgi:2-desacetyl-2-hydroxyethyl bacteriochlorophyllide A dehydrogenase
MKSKIIMFPAAKQVGFTEREVPDPGPGEVQVQTLVTLISTGTESWCFRGEFDADTGWAGWVKYPFTPGYSNVGRVLKVGEGVAELAEGDRVFSTAGHCQYTNLGAHTASMGRLPDYASDEDAAWCTLSYITQTAVRRAEHSMGDTAVVIGLGPLGQLVTQYLRVVGCREVLAIDTVQMRLDMALAHGATQGFLGSAADARDFVLEHTDGQLADVVYDVTGHYAVFPLALKLVRNFGTLLLLGDTPHPSRQCLTHDVLTRQLRVIGTHNDRLPPEHAHWTGARQAQLFLQYIHRGQMRVADLVTHRFSPMDAPKVYPMLQTEREGTMGVLFDWRECS